MTTVRDGAAYDRIGAAYDRIGADEYDDEYDDDGEGADDAP
jgi:hypothetical protein